MFFLNLVMKWSGEFAFVVYKLVALLMGAKPVEVEMPFLVHDLSK